MAGQFICSGMKRFFCLFLFSYVSSSIAYGIERSPIVWATSGVYFATPYQAACEYWASLRDVQYVGIPSSQYAEIKKMWVIPWGYEEGVFNKNVTPAIQYQCGVTIHHYGNPPGVNPYDYEWAFGGAFPVCSLGDSPYVSSDAICTIPDITVDKGANLGEPEPELCTANPINTTTGNKYAKETDIGSSNGLSFARYYNSDSLSGTIQIGASWRHAYQNSLFVNPETVTAARTDGKLVYFRLAGSDWINQLENNEHLTQIDDGNGNITGWQLTTVDDTIEAYDTVGRLQSIVGRDGRTQTLVYDTNNRLNTVIDDIGRELNFTYDGSGRVETIIDPAGGIYWYDYDTAGNLISAAYPDGKTRGYHYNETAYTSGANLPHALTGITDESGVRYATYTYDASGRAIVTEHADGADRYQLSYSTDGSSTVVTDPLGSQYTHQFQTILSVARSIGQSQPAGSGCNAASSAITYDINGNVASRTDFNGNKTCYTHDLNRNLEIARVEGLISGSACPGDLVNYTPAANSSERKMLTDWHLDFRLPVRVTEADRETTVNYDAYGNVTQLSIHDTGSGETRTWNTRYTYHPTVTGVIVQRIIDGPRTDVNDITTINYYAPDAACDGGHLGCRGQVMRITNALGHVTDITRYNAHGQPEQIVDANNLTTTLTYDARQRLVSRVTGTETTTYRYDNVGQLAQLTRSDGSAIHFTYDAAHRLTEITDSLGNAIRHTLDAAGNRTKEEIFDAGNALAQTRQHEFDALSRLWKMVGAQNQITEFAYDANGNLKQTVDPLSHTSTRQFDTLNRLIQVNDPMGGQTLQQHDARDQIVQVTDPKGTVTRYTTNVFGDVLHEVSQDRGTTSYTYDATGNQLTRIDARGVVQTTVYDALNRPVSQSYNTVTGVPATKTITWTYDSGTNGIGRLTGMTDESGSTRYQYDVQGRLLNMIQTVRLFRKSFTHAINYQYDAGGRLIRAIYPSGTQIDYAYGIDGRPTAVRVNGDILMQNITYRPFGEPQSWYWGTGRAYSRSYDLDGRLTQHLLGADTQTLTYDAASQITNTTHTNPVYNHTYEYDALSRLIRQTGNTSTRLWEYDANSNRIFEQSGAVVYPYTIEANSNRLLRVAGPVVKDYAYDAAGNTLSDGMLDFSWNAAGRLSSVSSGGEAKVFSLYNGHGERTLKWHYQGRKTVPTIFVFDSDGKIIGDYSQSENIRESNVWRLNQETVWLGDIPVAVIKQTAPTEPVEIYTIDADHLNTPQVIVDSTGTPVWLRHNRNAFGDNLPHEDHDGDGRLFKYNLRFAGQYFDTETNLHYNYFRDYEPATGRYLSSDPIGLTGGLNTYGYVLQNPLSFIDPTGEYVPPLLLWALGGALTLWDMLAPIEPHPVYPGAIESVVTLPGPLGKIGSSKKLCDAPRNVEKLLDGVPVETFEGTIKHKVLKSDVDAFRFSGGISDPKGRFLTTRQTLRKTGSPQDAQRVLKLPEGATADTLNKFTIPKGTNIFVGRVKGGSPGATQVFIKDPGVLK